LPGQPPPRKMAKFGKCVGVIVGNELMWMDFHSPVPEASLRTRPRIQIQPQLSPRLIVLRFRATLESFVVVATWKAVCD